MRTLKVAQKKEDHEKIKYNFFVFDVETKKGSKGTALEPMPKNFVFGVIYGFNYQKVIYSVEGFKTEFKNKRYENKYIFAHNAEFDLLTIFGNIITQVDNNAIFNGKFITAKHNKITFGDSMNIYPTSVKKIGEMLGTEKHIDEKIKKGSLTKANLTKKDIAYCIQDCKIVWDALLEIFETIGVIKLTLPSLSMYQFRSNYLKKDIQFKETVDEFYESYYGGRTEAFRLGKTEAKVYDINSMYPDAMLKTQFPDIQHLHKETQVDMRYLLYILKLYEGMAKVTVRHKPSYFGYLPVKMKVNGSEKLVFPIGEFTTSVNFNELRFAVSEGIVEILEVHYVVYGNPMTSPFKQFIIDNYEKKRTATNKLTETIYKLIMNSLYGKFAQRMKLKTVYYENIPFEIISELSDNEDYFEVKLFNQERNDCYLITDNEKMKQNFFSIPAYSSYITSAARVLLLKNLIANENNNVCYCDTDSIVLSGNFIGSISDSLGDFKREQKIVTEIRGLKNYTYTNEYGETINVIKGISKSASQEKGTAIYKIPKYYKTKQSLRQGKKAGEAFIMTKQLKHDYDKRIVNKSTGETKPIKL
jgi:hypothetical protein